MCYHPHFLAEAAETAEVWNIELDHGHAVGDGVRTGHMQTNFPICVPEHHLTFMSIILWKPLNKQILCMSVSSSVKWI